MTIYLKTGLLCGMILCVIHATLLAQYRPEKINKRARALYMDAQAALDMQNLTQAIAYLKMAVKADSQYLDAWAQLASIAFKQKDYPEAVIDFQRVMAIDSTYDPRLYYAYAKSLAGMGKFAEAIAYMHRYLQIPGLGSDEIALGKSWLQHFEIGLQTALQHHPFAPQNLGDSINSADPEYFPSLTVDGQTLVFTRNLHNQNEDFYISTWDAADSQWHRAVNLGPPVNTPENEGTGHISQDGRILIYAACNQPGGLGSCDIVYSVRTAQGWSTPVNLGPNVNSRFWDSQPCLSPDNHDLYFVSNRPGGYGGSDIYVCHLQPDGSWSKPENLGPNINTPGDETSPFIHADNQTLYFASNGWPGIGDMDLFYSRRQPDGSWSKPVNLGYPINTIDHDGTLFVAADGKTAYFASDRFNGYGQLDLYAFTLYPEARPIPTLYVRGTVYDSLTHQPLSASIDLIDVATDSLITRIHSDIHGQYLVTLPIGKIYAFHVSHPGYLFYSDQFSLVNQKAYRPYEINIPLQPIRLHARMVLKNIFFDFNKYDLKPESKPELDKLVQFLKDNPTLHITIKGYTDSVGTASFNLTLSQHRAEAVMQYLIAHGIQANRLKAVGYGEAQPVASNETEEGRALNRRVEFEITEQ
ncbi:MAG: OmpA family protein [Thermoflavifilum sp.]|uniref:OmpA family protein n=1 Tax=Thermoflavifilum sp. TaxID=1968839 RepID=UPI0018A500CD|nr:OmpA family protein [Thermoflavifilum sp.]QOR76325.1 MAG: OmpA family protein [Thermoflavifilum sp.]